MASEVFFDPYNCHVDATVEGGHESREALIGYSDDGYMLFVVHVDKSENGYRIVSARKATSIERKCYEGR